MLQVHDDMVQRFRVRLGLLVFLKRAVTYLTLWAFCWGMAVLVLRAAAGTPRTWLLLGGLGVPLALLVAVVRMRQQLPARTAVRAFLDRRSGCGGLLMAAEEVELGAWQETMLAVAAPRVRWHGRRAWALLAAGVVFVLLGFLVPERFAGLEAGNPFEIGPEIKKLAAQIDVLKEEAILEPVRAEALKQKLEQVKQEASGKDPVKTLEALDHLENVTGKTAREAAEELLRKTEKLARAQTLAEALKEAGSALEPKVLTRAMAELAAMTEKAARESETLRKELDPGALKDGKAGALSREQLEKLAEALRDSKGDIAARLDKLHKAGLIDRGTLKECEKCGACKGGDLAALIKARDGKGKEGAGKDGLSKGKEGAGKDGLSLEDLLAYCKEGGRGGLTRGPGPSPLILGKETSAEGAKFKEQALPPAGLAALKESKLTGLSKEAPKNEPGGPSQSGALDGTAPGGGSAQTQVVLPRHRGTVERFFERPPAPGK